jgi:hypothetical protein
MTFVDEIFEDGTVPIEEDVTPFVKDEDEGAESLMSEEEVK